MTSQLATMLDELMGKQRNLLPEEQKKDFSFEDEDVCRYFLVGFCPNELFVNTKSDLGQCTKMHDEKLKEAYRNSDKFEKLGYEDEFLSFLQKMHNDMERKIKRHKERLSLNQTDGNNEETPQGKLEAKIKQLSHKMNEYLEQAEKLGAEAKVEQSLEATRVADRYKNERDMAIKSLSLLAGAQEDIKPMEVCEICGCFLIVGDAQQRIDEHMTGKQHMGYAKIKSTVEELQRRKEERLLKEREEREKKEKERDRSSRSEKDRDRHHDRDKDRKVESKDRDERSRKRSRSRDRDRDRSARDRDSDRNRKSSRHHRSRSRSRDRHSRHSTSSRSHRGGDRDRGDRHHSDRDRKDRDRDSRRERRRDEDKKRRSEEKKPVGKEEKKNGSEAPAATSEPPENGAGEVRKEEDAVVPEGIPPKEDEGSNPRPDSDPIAGEQGDQGPKANSQSLYPDMGQNPAEMEQN